MKKIVVLLALLVAGCATKPMPCEVKVKGECREMTASERNGAVVRGHNEEIKDSK
jgi:uncharacterized lipoprotein YajG